MPNIKENYNLFLILKKISKISNEKLYGIFSTIISTADDNTEKKLYYLFLTAAFFVLSIFSINIILQKEEDNLGVWGDFFGGVLNPILTFITFMGLLITIVLQQKELRETRNELAGQKEALSNQQKEMVKQTFDNKFFQMLNAFDNVRKHSNISNNFDKIKYKLDQSINNSFFHDYTNYTDESRVKDLLKFKNSYIYINNENDLTIKYYFINLYQIMDYVDRESPDSINPKKYMNIVRAQLSKKELVLLLFNAIGVLDFSGDKFKKLIESYAFFEHLQYSDLGINADKHNFDYKEYVNYVIFLIAASYRYCAFGKNIKFIEIIKEKKNAYKC